MAMTNEQQAPERLRRYLEEAFMAAEERRIRAEENLQREYADADAERERAARIWRMAQLGPLPEYRPDRRVIRSA